MARPTNNNNNLNQMQQHLNSQQHRFNQQTQPQVQYITTPEESQDTSRQENQLDQPPNYEKLLKI